MIEILVTGSNGQLGSELRNRVQLFDNAHVVFTDIEDLNITDMDSLVKFCGGKKFQYIINCAAYTAVDKAETETDLARKINVDAVRNLVNISNQLKAFLIHISTDYVFSGTNFVPYKEDNPISPNSVYGKTKADGEIEALKYQESIVIRTSWLYSAYGNNFVKTIRRLAAEREKLTVIYDQIGTPTYAGDLAISIISIINYQQKNGKRTGIYHFSNEGVCSWYDFACEITELTGGKAKIIPIETKDYPSPTQRPYYSVLNKSKIKTTFEIEIPHWKESLKVCLNKLENL